RHQEAAADPEHAGDESDREPHHEDEEHVDRHFGDRKVDLHGLRPPEAGVLGLKEDAVIEWPGCGDFASTKRPNGGRKRSPVRPARPERVVSINTAPRRARSNELTLQIRECQEDRFRLRGLRSGARPASAWWRAGAPDRRGPSHWAGP